ncbi:hypothetical protein [Taibaiella soli]|uniref:Uncharacterized protein n=1 Tax=Taibaiella soli TaxID=1649169 RepID=A0A2W2AB25_9BACT|nr:hypothetical protein [Taibaiella soli]PZF72605.1 hypothetical protein DN068_12120 [Taibaiella soli]
MKRQTQKIKEQSVNSDLDKYTNKELAESFVFPSKKSAKQTEEEKEFWEKRRTAFENRSSAKKIYSRLLQLKYQIEDYIKSDDYDERTTFGYFLKEYIHILDKKNNQFASEIDITPTELSQIINSHRKPKENIIIRLEIHSNENIPAITWYRLLEKEKEHEIITDKIMRKSEKAHVKRIAEFSL